MTRRCHSCGALLSENADVCAECGASVFISEESTPIRRIHAFYGLDTFYVKLKRPTIINDEPQGFEVEWRLLLARPQLRAPPIFIWERDGLVSPGRPEAALKAVDKADLVRILGELPEKKRKALIKILKEEWGEDIDEENLEEALRPYIYQSVPRLRESPSQRMHRLEEALRMMAWTLWALRRSLPSDVHHRGSPKEEDEALC